MIRRKFLIILCLAFIINILYLNNTFAAENINNLNAIITVEEGESSAHVLLEYNLKITENTKEIPLKGLLFSDTKIEDIKAQYDGFNISIHLDQSNSPGFSGSVKLPDYITQLEEATITIEYDIANAVIDKNQRYLLEAPLVIVDWKPSKSEPGVFTSEVILPGNIYLEEKFPTTTKLVKQDNNQTTIEISLQTLPSMIRLSGKKGSPVFLTYGRKIDLIVLLILIFGAYYGYKLLRKKEKE